uniref:Uncharacterized protein n=1 Tax=Anguilla anguilla TaxID=7936 RepID=A0A0E9T5B7_ANGAN
MKVEHLLMTVLSSQQHRKVFFSPTPRLQPSLSESKKEQKGNAHI